MRSDKELYANIRIGVYSKTVKVTGTMENPSNEVYDTVLVFLSTWSLLCNGRCRADVVIPFFSPYELSNTVLRVWARELGPHTVASNPVKQ